MIELRGEAGARLRLKPLQFLDDAMKFVVEITLGWGFARGSVEASRATWDRFNTDLLNLSGLETKQMSFYPEYGFFELEFNLDHRSGIILVSGKLGENEHNVGYLRFEFETYASDIERFQKQINQLVKGNSHEGYDTR